MAIAHSRSYDVAIVVAKGEPITVGQRDDRWPEWMWCTRESTVRAARDFDNGELTVAAGDRIRTGERLGGWIRCTADDGRSGWVPEDCLT